MMTFEMTYHASVERVDRLSACVQYLGMSKFIYEKPDRRHPGTVQCVTSTGIIIVKNAVSGALITGWMATPKQIAAIYKGRAPQKLFNRVVKNNERYAFLLEM